jgi:hypothetical protein
MCSYPQAQVEEETGRVILTIEKKAFIHRLRVEEETRGSCRPRLRRIIHPPAHIWRR